ncbi:hypothetical protein BJP62_17740 [Jeongeupia sp. USM3]|nr:hypothetical protein BJP62_17740 [Jeongeupia sp. USM3]
MPMSVSRVTALAASLVCSVASMMTGQRRLHGDLRGFEIADFADHDHVRILAQARSARAKLMSILGLICVWPTPSRSYSIGSSTVMMLAVFASICDSAAYSVVVLPERSAR